MKNNYSEDIILSFKHVHKSFFGVEVLEDINLDIRRGSILGLIGENGAGKSTLMNILGGNIPCDQGEILLNGKPYRVNNAEEAAQRGISFIHQELNLFTNLSIAENLFINNFPKYGKSVFIDKQKANTETKKYLDMVELDLSPNILVERLSPGERQLVEVAKALSTEASIIIFDEPSTSLTNRETERLFKIINRLHETGRTIIYISHILGDILRLADDIAILRDGKLIEVGPKDTFTVNRMIKQMVGRDINQLYPDRVAFVEDEKCLEVKHLSKSGIVKDINFTLYKNEILGMFGLMGSGRTELAQLIFGVEQPDEGEIILHGEKITRCSPRNSIQHEVGYVTENRREEGLMMTATVAENIKLSNFESYLGPLNTIREKQMNEDVKNISDSLKIKSTNIFKTQAKGLSGGNQQKVVLAKWLMRHPRFLIIDEPTRGIDIGAKYEIYQILTQLAQADTSILFISSEIEELMGVCDRILLMSYGEIVGEVRREDFDREKIMAIAFRESEDDEKI